METLERVRRGLEGGMLSISIDPSKVHAGARLREDLGLDSLEEVAMELWIEEEYGIAVPNGASDDWLLVSDVVSFIEKAVSEQGCSA